MPPRKKPLGKGPRGFASLDGGFAARRHGAGWRIRGRSSGRPRVQTCGLRGRAIGQSARTLAGRTALLAGRRRPVLLAA